MADWPGLFEPITVGGVCHLWELCAYAWGWDRRRALRAAAVTKHTLRGFGARSLNNYLRTSTTDADFGRASYIAKAPHYREVGWRRCGYTQYIKDMMAPDGMGWHYTLMDAGRLEEFVSAARRDYAAFQLLGAE